MKEEIGLIARDVGLRLIDNPEPATLYYVAFKRADGTQGSRLGGFSVPGEIADEVAAQLALHGYSVE